MAKVSATISMGALVTCRYDKSEAGGRIDMFRKGRVIAPPMDIPWVAKRRIPGTPVVDCEDGVDQMVFVQLFQEGNKMHSPDERVCKWLKLSKMLPV